MGGVTGADRAFLHRGAPNQRMDLSWEFTANTQQLEHLSISALHDCCPVGKLRPLEAVRP